MEEDQLILETDVNSPQVPLINKTEHINACMRNLYVKHAGLDRDQNMFAAALPSSTHKWTERLMLQSVDLRQSLSTLYALQMRPYPHIMKVQS